MKIRQNLAISGTGFIFDPTSGDSYTMNPVGAEMAEMLKKQISQQEIVKHFVKKYDVDEATLEKDLMDFVNILNQYRLTESDEDEN